MVAHPRGARLTGELGEGSQVVVVRRIGPADTQGDSVLHHAVGLADGREVVARLAASDHEVFAYHLEEVDAGPIVEDVSVVRHAKADADSEIWESESGVIVQ